jgi:glycosyltransferase involved in cell wall biosynthesis
MTMLATNTVFHPGVKPAGWVICSASRRAVVLAARNEVLSITEKVQRLIEQGDVVIVVDDNSVDGTSSAAEAAGALVIRPDESLSFHHAIRQGIRLASSLGDQVLVMRG